MWLDVVMGRRKTFKDGERTVLYVRVDKQIRADLNKLAAAENRTLNNYMATLLLNHINTVKQVKTA